jgi:3-oxoacyl-[acyl-carrier-protein] synthase III
LFRAFFYCSQPILIQMSKIRAKITGIDTFLPEYRLNNQELSQMVDTTDEWIMTRVGIKERRILKDKDKSSGFMGAEAVKNLLKKTGTSPDEIELLICATTTGDYLFPSTASIIMHQAGLHKAFGFDIAAACSGFIFGLDVASKYIASGAYKKVILVGSDKMSAITDYTNRTTCPLFGDAAGAVLLEPSELEEGVIDTDLHVDGIGLPYLNMPAGGSLTPPSHDTVDAGKHFIFQEGKTVFKHAVSNMAEVATNMMKKHNIQSEDLAWLVPHQANMRIIEATAYHMGISKDQVMINIERYGNTTSATIPLCIWEWESRLKKGDKIILAAFGAGFTWGAVYLVWGYDGKDVVK